MSIPLAVVNLLAAALTASATSPQFVPAATSAHRTDGVVIVSFTESGLSAGAADTVTATVTDSMTVSCSGSMATSMGQSVNGAVFTADSHGQLVGSIAVPSPSLSVNVPGCTVGQETITATVTDLVSGATIDVPVVDE